MRRKDIISFDRTRRIKRWALGNPPQGSRGQRRRRAGPGVRIRTMVVVAAAGVLVLPYGADMLNAALGARSVEGCRVVRVIDGDTVTLWCPETGTERTRLVGYDTPEKSDPGCVSEYAAAQQATWHLRQLLATHERMEVRLIGLDRFDRRLAVVTLDGTDLARLMVDAGHARAYSGGRRQSWCAA